MDWVLASIKAVVGLAGVVCAALFLILPLVSIQGMTGQEAFAPVVPLFAGSFALAFGVGAGSLRALAGGGSLWSTARAFAIGGSIGGALVAATLTAATQFDRQLRVLTHGGPIGGFLLAGIVAAILIAGLVGTGLLRRTQERG